MYRMMKGRANISGIIAGRGSLGGTMAARAAARGMIDGQSRSALKPIPAEGERTRATGLQHWLQVTPTEPQQLLWLTPQYGIDYQIETSTKLKWKII